LEPVAEAIARGVRVDLFLRAMNHRDGHRRDAALLHRLGVHILADDLTHAKAAVADNRAGVLFSANFDAQHGLDAGSGIEVGARLDGTPALSHLVTYLDHASACAKSEFVDTPTGRDMDARLDQPWQTRWPLDHNLRVDADNPTWHALSAINDIVLWHRESPNRIVLTSGSRAFALTNGSPHRPQLALLSTPTPTAAALSEQWWKSHRDRGKGHGYCPAVLRR
jgi:hypothetical protein